ncbi:MAG: glycoside hydrolase domain-containing protein [Caulobacteraceae bacterium]
MQSGFRLIAASLLGWTVAAGASAQIASAQRVDAPGGVVSTGRALLATADQGRHWADITPAGAGPIDGVFFLDAARGWLLRSTPDQTVEIARTANGGGAWSVAAFPLSAEDAAGFSGPASLDFIDPRHGWALFRRTSSPNFSNGLLFATADGGATWTRLPDPPVGDPVRFLTLRDGWQAGGPLGDLLFVTHDGGQSWSAVNIARPAGVPTDAAARYEAPKSEAGGAGIALAATYVWPGGSATVLYRSADGGAHWSARIVGAGAAGANPPAVTVADGHVVQVTSSFGALTTRIDGAAAPGVAHIPADASVDSAHFVDARDGWIVTSVGGCAAYKRGCSVEQRLLGTTDAGASFQDITPSRSAPIRIADGPSRAGSTTLGSGEGFDACSPSVSGLSTWFKNSPYRYVNVYIGGTNAYCPQPGLTTAWVNTVVGQGWGLIPTWVGLQAPCTSSGGSTRFSTNPTKAASQGAAEARSATAKMASIGLSGTIVYYDLEYYNDTRSCAAATKAFLNAWVQGLHGQGYTAGVYGSPTNANADWLGLANLPDDVWMALWNGNAGVFHLPPLPNSDWANHQRIHQYQGNVNQTFGGVRYNIDQDFLDGPVAK